MIAASLTIIDEDSPNGFVIIDHFHLKRGKSGVIFWVYQCGSFEDEHVFDTVELAEEFIKRRGFLRFRRGDNTVGRRFKMRESDFA